MVRTGGPGMGGVSLLLIEAGMEGFTRTPLRKMGWHASDTATLYFDDVRVPVGNLIGEENQGFRIIMQNFNYERLMMAASCTSFARVCYDETVAYARERKAFGHSLLDNQVVHFRLAELRTEVESLKALTYQACEEYVAGGDAVMLASMAKLKAGRVAREVTDACLQWWGGQGFMWDNNISRAYRDTRLVSIGGGADEIMLGIIAKLMGTLPSRKSKPASAG